MRITRPITSLAALLCWLAGLLPRAAVCLGRTAAEALRHWMPVVSRILRIGAYRCRAAYGRKCSWRSVRTWAYRIAHPRSLKRFEVRKVGSQRRSG